MKRVLIIANKTWEVEPLINALLSPEFKSKNVLVSGTPNVHDGHPVGDENVYSKLHVPDQFEKELASTSNSFIDQLMSSTDFIKNVELRFLKPFLNPSKNIRVIIKQNQIALSGVNVTDYREYDAKDQEGIKAVNGSGTKNEICSIETTHGIIRILSNAPFVFVSGITNRTEYFGTEVGPKTVSQNYTCAYNAGIAIAWMVPELLKYLATP